MNMHEDAGFSRNTLDVPRPARARHLARTTWPSAQIRYCAKSSYNPAPMALTFHHHQLKNGLDIIAEENPDSYSIALGIFVKTGARDEDPKLNGVSHFLEHMMFKGSEKY